MAGIASGVLSASEIAQDAANIVAECVFGGDHIGGSVAIGSRVNFEVVLVGRYSLAREVETQQGGGFTALEEQWYDRLLATSFTHVL